MLSSLAMDLILIRHAEPEWTRDGWGVDDPGLTRRGRAQAERLGVVAPGWSADELWVSPARRAAETAAPVARSTGLAVQERAWLSELDLPGRSAMRAEQVQTMLKASRGRSVQAWWDGYAGGEAIRAFVDRVAGGLDGEMVSRSGAVRRELGLWDGVSRDGRIVIVSHAGTSAVLVSHLLGLPQVPWPWLRIMAAHASVTRLRSVQVADGVIFSLRGLGDVSMHPEDQRTA